MKVFADDNFKFGENGRKLKTVENHVAKGEIARYEQFLLYLQCFQKICTADMQKPVLKRFKSKSMNMGKSPLPEKIYMWEQGS